MMTTHKWASLLRDYWPNAKYPATVGDAERWESELDAAITNGDPISDQELCEVVRELSMRDGMRFSPSLKQLRIALYTHRKQQRPNMPNWSPTPDCPLCYGEGWLMVVRTVKDWRAAGIGAFIGGPIVRETVPCVCRAGEEAMDKAYPPEEAGRLQQIRDLALEQHQHLISLINQQYGDKTHAEIAREFRRASSRIGQEVAA